MGSVHKRLLNVKLKDVAAVFEIEIYVVFCGRDNSIVVKA